VFGHVFFFRGADQAEAFLLAPLRAAGHWSGSDCALRRRGGIMFGPATMAWRLSKPPLIVSRRAAAGSGNAEDR
jgi:hypothetical protein